MWFVRICVIAIKIKSPSFLFFTTLLLGHSRLAHLLVYFFDIGGAISTSYLRSVLAVWQGRGPAVSSLATFLIRTSQIAIVPQWTDTHTFVTWLGERVVICWLFKKVGGVQFTIEMVFRHLTKTFASPTITITIISNLRGKKVGPERRNK